MLTPQFVLPVHTELVVDLFAGGGGASTGIEQAIGRHVDIAVNHDPEAVSLHTANHPPTRHFCSDVFEVDPLAVTDGQPVGLLWASPDCKHFSKAKGGKPVSKKIRGLGGDQVGQVDPPSRHLPGERRGIPDLGAAGRGLAAVPRALRPDLPALGEPAAQPGLQGGMEGAARLRLRGADHSQASIPGGPPRWPAHQLAAAHPCPARRERQGCQRIKALAHCGRVHRLEHCRTVHLRA